MAATTPIPILLLKTPSPTPPTDPYTTHLTHPSTVSTRTYIYTPHYIPVLTHTLLPDSLITLLLSHLQPATPAPFPYGGIILTSQRAVAALTTALNAPPIQNRLEKLKELELGFYTVGPATERGLVGVRDRCMPLCGMYGGEGAGSGEVLARVMLGMEGGGEGKYEVRDERGGMKPVLFLTGEKRRDVIPRMLMEEVDVGRRVKVDEVVVYETRELEEFGFGFGRVVGETETETEGGVRWVVVFSPTAGRGVLGGLGWLDGGSGRVREGVGKGRRTFVCCIGPTTREYLEKEFGFEADVVAEKPSPQGVKDAIERFMDQRRL